MLTDEQFEQQVLVVTEKLETLAEGLTADGLVVGAGQVLAGVQTIRRLWTQLHPSPVEDIPAGEPK